MKEKYIRRNRCRSFNNFCALVMLLVFLVNVLSPVAEFSELENRYLQNFPKFSLGGLFDGSYAEDIENYFNDHFVGRNMFVKLKAGIEYLIGKHENNGVYVAKDEYLIEKPAEFDKKLIDNNLKAIKTLDDLGRYNITVSVIPTAFEIMKDMLPESAYRDTIPKLNAYIADYLSKTDAKNVDTTENLSKYKDDYLYYRTDHHTTSNGSFVIYNTLADTMGYTPLSASDFKIYDVTREFLGTTYSKALKDVTPDIITEYKPLETPRFKVKFPYDNKEADSMYFPEHLAKKDKYSYFLDGNHALTVIESPNKNGKSLAVFRDSYANCTVPMIANHYETIHMIDLRYYNDDIIGYLTENRIENVLFMYSAQTFMTDTTISKITSYAKNSPYCTQEFGEVFRSKPVDDSYFADTLFIGDSLTDGFRMYSGLTDATFLCGTSMTVDGIHTREWQDGITMIDKIKQGGFKKVYIMLGVNENLVMDYKDTFVQKYGDLVDIVCESNPDAVIYIQSMLPVSASRDEAGKVTNPVIDAFNEGLYNLAYEKHVFYLDINKTLKDENGQLPEDAARDGVHFHKEYYLKWLDFLRNHAVRTEEDETGKRKPVVIFENGDYDVSAIADKILENVKFKDELGSINAKVLAGIYGIDENLIQNAAGYAGGGATAEEIAVFEAKKIADAREIEKKVKEHIENRKKSFESYIPEEIPKLKRPFIYSNGKLVVVCVADSYGKLENILKEFVK